jgi:uncharacterized protein involved in exopolysaccharide biosynthesis
VTDTPPEPPAAPPAEPAEPASGPTVNSLDARLDRLEGMLGELLSRPQQSETDEAEIKRQVREGARKIAAAEKADAAEAAERQTIADQIAELKAEVEKAPQEYKRATQRMGWTTP